MALNLVFIGAPGAGKGTIASVVAKELGIPHLSTGEMFRSEKAKGSPLGKHVQSILDSGGLVDDDTTGEIVQQRLKEPDISNGFILDGYPRNVQQANTLEGILFNQNQPLTAAVLFYVPDEVLIKRLSGRRYCPKCKRTYNVYTVELMSKANNQCDDCGILLQQRADDRPEAVRKRLHLYNTHVAPIIKFYQQKNLLKELNASGTINENLMRLKELLKL